MTTVKCEPLDRWGWECPDCEHWNEEESDPSYQETVYCESCKSEFEPEVTG